VRERVGVREMRRLAPPTAVSSSAAASAEAEDFIALTLALSLAGEGVFSDRPL
jgi:hypothetical protein